MTWNILIDKGLSVAFMLGCFAALIFFLRFLYGPKGRFRDPQWDRWNEEARVTLEKTLDDKADAALREQFFAYAGSFFSGDAKHDAVLQLKIDHSFRVVALAEEIAAAEPALSAHAAARVLRLSALFHDVGRFEQFKRYGTFADALSCNHGALGAAIIKRQGFLKTEHPELQRLVRCAVAVHNRFSVPASLTGLQRDIVFALRDADKLDVLHIMGTHLAPGVENNEVVLLHLADEPDAYSPAILQALEERRSALYSDMRFFNDFKLLLCSWLFDLHFSTTYRIAKRTGHMHSLVASLASVPEVQRQAKAVVAEFLGAS